MPPSPDWREVVRSALSDRHDVQKRLIDCFQADWLQTAGWAWRNSPFLRAHTAPEDLVQGFVADALPRATHRLPWDPDHVRSYLRVCVLNYCRTVARRLEVQRVLLPGRGGDVSYDPVAPPEGETECQAERTLEL